MEKRASFVSVCLFTSIILVACGPSTPTPLPPTPTPSKTVDKWIEILESEDEAERLEAVIALGKMGPAASDALPQLFLALEGKDVVTGVSEGSFVDEVGTAIAAIAEENAVALCEVWFLDGSIGYTTFCAIEVLPKVGEGAVPGLVDLLTTRDDRITRLGAVSALSQIAGHCDFGRNEQLAVNALQTTASNDPDKGIRTIAQQALAWMSKCKQ
jgi:HEAT repeat protein